MKFLKPVVLTDAMLISSTAPETDYTAWNAATAYSVGNKVIRTQTHRIYERLIAGTTATAPESDPVNWLDIAPTNRWAMFDRTVGTVTSIATPLTVVIATGIVNALALLDLAGTSVDVSMTDGAGGPTVYSQSYTLPDAAEIVDWYGYFFEPLQPQTELIVENLPPYANGRLTVTINAATTAACGTLAVGGMVTLGAARYGTSIGITDYSKKEVDVFGVASVIERSYAKRFDVPLMVENTRLDYLAKQLAGVRATPCVWIAHTDYSSLIAYGFFKDWSANITYPAHSEMRLTIEGLT